MLDLLRQRQCGMHTCHVPWTDGRTEIHVVNSQTGKYKNNLDDLPNC